WITTGDGSEYGSCAVLLATGADYRPLGVAGEEDFIGAGVHFCSTCDGPFYKDKSVVVVGGGNSAAEESLGLLRFAKDVTLLVRGDRLKASKILVEKVMSRDRITVRYNTAVTKLTGDHQLETVHIKDKITGVEDQLGPDGLFVFIGQQPNTGFLKSSQVRLDPYGYILTGHHLAQDKMWQENRELGSLETSLPGVFAAGDVRVGSTNQVASAAGEGATASILIRDYLNNL
ncbi:MAG: FAD-dependent oxidoreductase, partial [Chloroflexota bacterium]